MGTAETFEKVIEILQNEARGAPLFIAKKLNLTLIEVIKVLDYLIKEGKVEKRGKIYRLKKRG